MNIKTSRTLILLLVCCAMLAGGVAFGRTIIVSAMPVSPYADTEVSTNIALHALRTDTCQLDIHLQFGGTATNALGVAFGCDLNTNGVLDAEEVETVYGWRAGRYSIENVRSWERIETLAATNALCGVLDIHLENDSSVAPRRFTATCGGVVAFVELSAKPIPPWLFRREWDMARVTRRGALVPAEWVRCDIKYQSFTIRLR